MNLTTVLYGVADGVATITLNRPESRNALNRAMCEDLVTVATAVAADRGVRLVLLRASGPVFCAGADLKERKGMTVDEVRTRRMRGFAAYDALEACRCRPSRWCTGPRSARAARSPPRATSSWRRRRRALHAGGAVGHGRRNPAAARACSASGSPRT